MCRQIHKFKICKCDMCGIKLSDDKTRCDVCKSLNYKMSSGKYKGKTIEFVYLNDWNYARKLYFECENLASEHMKFVIDNY